MTAPMRFLSVCSGIEAASVAWEPLGWQAAAFAEIDPFASAVLAHHYPDVPNLGDMTRYQEWPDLGPIDIVCGGPPCQAFSVAGLRKGIADPRGNLTLTYLGIVDRYRPRWVVYENVPGLLSSNGGRDFGAFLGGLAELGYGFAWRVLDAQYVRVEHGFPRAVPQRRRRIFLVGHSGGWAYPAAVLSQPESVLGDTSPRRTAGEGSAADVAPSLVSSGRGVERTGETRGQDPVVAVAFGGGNTSGPIEAAACLTAKGHRSDFEVETFVAHTLKAEGFDASEDGTGRGTPIVPVYGLRSDAGRAGEAKTPSPDAEGRVRLRDPGFNVYDGVAPTLDAGQPHSVGPVAFDTYNQTVSEDGATQTLCSRGDTPGGNAHLVPAVQHGYAVRRLTPVECSRLMGFPDDYLSSVTWRGKCPPPDGPMYKALGNSWAVNVARWVGQRIQMVEEIAAELNLEAAE